METGSASFGVDYTAPSFGELSFSAIEPYPLNEDDEPWGWIFAEREDVALEVSDNLSGVDADGSELSAAGTASPELVFSADGEGSLSGELSFSLTGDGTRLELRGTGIRIVDRAGNAADLSDLISYENSNLPEGAVGIAIDTEAPRVSLSFDNVDVRNGMYYNAARAGTVTVVDASFDLVRRFDPELEVAVVVSRWAPLRGRRRPGLRGGRARGWHARVARDLLLRGRCRLGHCRLAHGSHGTFL